MSNIPGYDLDGVFLSYGEHAGGAVRINTPLIEKLADDGVKELAIITNQGGMAFSKLPQPPMAYPTPRRVAARIILAVDAIEKRGVRVVGVYVSTYHPFFIGSGFATCRKTARELRDCLAPALPGMRLVVSPEPEARKPQPRMLLWAEVDHYFGDSETDREAAEAAGVPFTLVERFK